MAYCWDDERQHEPHHKPYIYRSSVGAVHAACDGCGWHSFGLREEKKEIVAGWAVAHRCPEAVDEGPRRAINEAPKEPKQGYCLPGCEWMAVVTHDQDDRVSQAAHMIGCPRMGTTVFHRKETEGVVRE